MLLTHARSAFARHGFDATSLRSIAQASGVDVALVAHHFGSKDALWLAVVDDIVTLAQPLIDSMTVLAADAQLGARQRLDRAVDEVIAHNFRHPDVGLFFATALTEPDQRLSILMQRLVGPYHDAMYQLVSDAIAAGSVAPQDADVLSSMLNNAISKTISYQHVLAQLAKTPFDANAFRASVRQTAMAMLDYPLASSI